MKPAPGVTMSELRQNFATKEWVVIATERARRPEEMAHHRERKPVASFVANCPFCPGNEKLTPPEVLQIGMGFDRNGARPPSGRNGAPPRAEAGGIVCRELPFLSGQREADSAGSSPRTGRHGCSVARASNTQ